MWLLWGVTGEKQEKDLSSSCLRRGLARGGWAVIWAYVGRGPDMSMLRSDVEGDVWERMFVIHVLVSCSMCCVGTKDMFRASI
mmetsp:Transcript_9775/g.28086  ORF Transcript_9775/g.28086 Transcript_9775/m.28086 type:complete len:83 (-) Transcript_9775:609-857(-)